MNKLILYILIFTCSIKVLFSHIVFAADQNDGGIFAHKTQTPISIDGKNNDTSWEQATWQSLNHLILGDAPLSDDFSGQFKILWDERQLYLLVEVIDDVLFDQHADPLHLYWDDDCLEIFIDEDASGGNHQFNFNAFAYHIALDNQVVDIASNNKDGSTNFVLLNDHIKSVWRRSAVKPNNIIWEVALSVYDDSFTLNTTALSATSHQKSQQAVKLSLGKTLGFMLAYCDNDGSIERESFMGSMDIEAVNGDKNLGYITADVFQKLTLIQ